MDLRAELVDEFTTWMSDLSARHAGRPRDELRALLLLALEREQIVTVAYRREIVGERLKGMPVDDPVRRAITDAVRWTWRDEQMHARWTRGALVRHADLPERIRVLLAQWGGHAAGWASASQHHHPWAEAPLSRALAELLELAGVATGRIPAAVREHLRYSSFRDFCAFNAAAEATAALGWERMAALAPAAGIDEADRAAFLTMAADERRHAAVFDTLTDAFDPEDRLRPGWTAARLSEAFGRVGQRFLATPSQGAPAWANPLGKGAPVVVREGDELEAVLDEVIAGSGLLDLVRERRPKRIAVKTTFMLAADRLDPSPHVGVALVTALAARLADAGAEVAVIEGRNVYDRFHANRDVASVAAYLGLAGLRIVDSQLDQVRHTFVRGLGEEGVCRTWRDADLRLVVAKVRSNPVTGAMLALEGVEGLGTRHDAFVFDDRGADRATATMMLLDALPPDWALLDAFSHVPHGVLGMMACPVPVHPRRLYASRDAVSVDCVAARHLGLQPEAWPRSLLAMAFDWFGDPRATMRVDGPDTPIAGWHAPDATEWGALLTRLAEPVYVHASGRGAAFLPPMDTAAFPPLDEPGPALRVARQVVRSLVQLQGPVEGLRTRHVLVGGRRVRLADTGGEGIPLVMLHGYPEDLHLWARLVRRLRGRRCIALDWPGLGDSEAFDDGADDPEGLARQLRRILDTLAVDEVHLLGADMGAQPALVFAALHPARARSVVVLDHLAFGDGETSWEIATMRRAGLATAAFRTTPRVVWQQCLRTFLPPGHGLPDSLRDEMWGCFRRPEVRRHLAALCRGYERALPGLPDLYACVRQPALIVWGARDPHFPPGQGRRLARTLPSARLEVIHDAGHWLHWTHAEAVGGLIEAHLEAPCTS